jgi:hypothetical protein
MKWYYYHIHVADAPGYSTWFQSRKNLKTESTIAQEAARCHRTGWAIDDRSTIDKDDVHFVDIAEQIDRDQYLRATIGPRKTEIEKVKHARRKTLPLLIGTLKYEESQTLLAERLKGGNEL